MKIVVTPIRPGGSRAYQIDNKFIRIVNKSRRPVPKRLLSQIISCAREVHQGLKGDSDFAASKKFNKKFNDARSSFPDAGIAHTWVGGYNDSKHYVSYISCGRSAIFIDTTIAQFKGNFSETAALIVIVDSNNFAPQLRGFYQHKTWKPDLECNFQRLSEIF